MSKSKVVKQIADVSKTFVHAGSLRSSRIREANGAEAPLNFDGDPWLTVDDLFRKPDGYDR